MRGSVKACGHPHPAGKVGGMLPRTALIALTILACDTALAADQGRAPDAADRSEAKEARVEHDFMAFSSALKLVFLTTGSFPTNAQGLASLVKKPKDAPAGWAQILPGIPADPWKNPYVYRTRKTGGYELLSTGPDGKPSEDDILKRYNGLGDEVAARRDEDESGG